MDETIKLGLDPQQVLDSLREMSEKSEELAKKIEESLGKDAAKNIRKFEEAAEKGSNNIGKFFSNLGKRVKEDMKAAFDFSRVLAGVKFTDEVAKGAKQVLEMEKAFDRLNVRIGASAKQFSEFKTNLGKTVAGTGASLEKVLPGVEAVAARGGVKDTNELSKIGETLAKAQAATGEDTGSMSEQVVDAIQARGEKVNAATMKAAVDAAIAARNAGTFQTATEAAAAIANVTPFAKQMGLSQRQTAGLAAQASTAGAPGVDILRQLLEKGTQVGGQGYLNQVLGSKIFKGGKLDVDSLSKINLNQFKGVSQQQMASITGFSGTSGDDFVRFVNAFKQGNDRFKQVVNGTDDTAKAFEAATGNFASRLDRFKEKLTNAGREIVGGLSDAAEGAFSGKGDKLKEGLSKAGKGVSDNAGVLAVGTAGTLAMGMLFGGGLKNLLKGKGGLAGGIAEGQALKSLGVQNVYVVNASEISSGGIGGGALEKTGIFSKLGGAGSGVLAAITSPAALTAAAVAAIGYVGLHSEKGMGTSDEMAERDRLMRENVAKGGSPFSGGEGAAMIADAVRRGAEKANLKVESKGPMTNPSTVAARGGGR